MNQLYGDIDVVRAGPAHLAIVVPLFDAYRVFYRQPSDPERARAFMAARLADERSAIFLAFFGKDGTSVGFTRMYETFSSIATKPLWILEDLYVKPEMRKTGVARALMARAAEYARGELAVGLTLETAIDNVPAQALYESLGYERERAFYKYNLTL